MFYLKRILSKYAILDFRASRDIDNKICGSPFYMPPEMLNKDFYDDKIDIWSLGIILFQMLHGEVPYISDC